MPSVVIEALKKSVTCIMFLSTPFANRCLIYSDWAFEVTLHSSSARQDSPCADSPDHHSVHKVYMKLSGAEIWCPLSILE